MKKEQIEIHLRYEGPDVDDGSMSIEDIVPVLQGFSSAYGKIAATDDPDSIHRLRITGVRPGSADIILEVWKTIGENVDSLTVASFLTAGGYFIVRKIIEVIKLKRHIKKQPFRERINAENSIVVSNCNNVNIEVPLEIFELFKSGQIDSDLNKMMSPLEEGRIDSAEFSARSPDGITLQERITAEERPYFDVNENITTTTRETWLIVKLNALFKSTKSGWAYLSDGSRVYYRYVGQNQTKLLQLFSYSGPVRVSCIAHLDENLKVRELEIFDLQKSQEELFQSQSNAQQTE